MDIGQNILGNLSEFAGGIAKGVLVVRKVENLFPKDEKSETKAVGTDVKLKDMYKHAKNRLKMSGGLARTGGKGFDRDFMAGEFGAGYTAMEVQYNPSSLAFMTMNGDKYVFNRPGMGAEGGNYNAKLSIPAQTTLTVTLIMEEINPANAFMWESEQLTGGFSSIGSAVNSVSSIKDKWQDNKVSLRKKGEAFLALLISPLTREVTFAFGGTVFHGNLTKVDVTYKMFDKQGEPVLMEILLKIAQSNNNEYDQKYWADAFSDYFDKHSFEGAIAEEDENIVRPEDLGDLI